MPIDLSRYKKVSNKNGGEYSGPCYFTGEGRDRFYIYPFDTYKDGQPRPNWFCRRGCANCPGQPTKMGGHWGLFTEKYGAIDNIIPDTKPQKEYKRKPPTMQMAKTYHNLLSPASRVYLKSRGVKERTINKMLVGTRRGKVITFPNIVTVDGNKDLYGIKYRYLPGHEPTDGAKYRMVPGSIGKSIYNFDVLGQHWQVIVIVESVMDVLLLDSLEVPAIAPYAGCTVWEPGWAQFIDADTIINIGDRDEPDPQHTMGPGEMYAKHRSFMLGAYEGTKKYKRVVTLMPPEPYSDISDMYQGGEDVRLWLKEVHNYAISQNNTGTE